MAFGTKAIPHYNFHLANRANCFIIISSPLWGSSQRKVDNLLREERGEGPLLKTEEKRCK